MNIADDINTLAEAQKAYVEFDHVKRFSMFFAPTTPYEDSTARHGAASFDFLINRSERLTFEQFADRIQKHYSVEEPRTAEVVRVLRACAAYPVTADRLGAGEISEGQSVWLKTCFKAHLREKGIGAPLPADLALASTRHGPEWDESRAEFELESARGREAAAAPH
ncbi:hypothetical protein [Paraburkholderia youngii]|uniref:hypothetical protein n=1 Tax=Paraburkholderia youngii TaxID=2782701 RepID=UPI003D25582C